MAIDLPGDHETEEVEEDEDQIFQSTKEEEEDDPNEQKLHFQGIDQQTTVTIAPLDFEKESESKFPTKQVISQTQGSNPVKLTKVCEFPDPHFGFKSFTLLIQ